MSEQKNTNNEFNEEKVRLLVKYLLENDIESYQKLILEIETLNSNDLYYLFREIKYKYDNLFKKDFSYSDKLNSIKEDFDRHKKQLQDLLDTKTKEKDYINSILSYTRAEQKRIEKYIEEKQETIKVQKSKQNKSLFEIGLCIILICLGCGKIVYTDAGFLFKISIVINAISGILHFENYYKQEDLIAKLNLGLDKEIEFKNRIIAINGIFDKIIKELEKTK